MFILLMEVLLTSASSSGGKKTRSKSSAQLGVGGVSLLRVAERIIADDVLERCLADVKRAVTVHQFSETKSTPHYFNLTQCILVI